MGFQLLRSDNNNSYFFHPQFGKEETRPDRKARGQRGDLGGLFVFCFHLLLLPLCVLSCFLIWSCSCLLILHLIPWLSSSVSQTCCDCFLPLLSAVVLLSCQIVCWVGSRVGWFHAATWVGYLSFASRTIQSYSVLLVVPRPPAAAHRTYSWLEPDSCIPLFSSVLCISFNCEYFFIIFFLVSITSLINFSPRGLQLLLF